VAGQLPGEDGRPPADQRPAAGPESLARA